MNEYNYVNLREKTQLRQTAANWFHEKWGVPTEAYQECRCQGISGKLLNLVVDDMKSKGITPLYLFTDHTGFYERYGWEFFCMAQGDGEPEPTRLYIHK
jgi:hypothetical protein